MPTAPLAAMLLTLGLLAGCGGGADCSELPGLTEKRDAARAEFAALIDRQGSGEAVNEADVDASHDRMHDLEARTAELSESCDRS